MVRKYVNMYENLNFFHVANEATIVLVKEQ